MHRELSRWVDVSQRSIGGAMIAIHSTDSCIPMPVLLPEMFNTRSTSENGFLSVRSSILARVVCKRWSSEAPSFD